MKASCRCGAEYSVNIGLADQELFCYRCSDSLKLPAIDLSAVHAVNTAIEAIEDKFVLSFDADGLALSVRNRIISTGKVIYG